MQSLNRKIIYSALSCLTLAILLVRCSGAEEPPVAEIITEVSRYLQGYPIEFTADLKGGENVGDYEFLFDFGDGFNAQGSTAYHTYMVPGTYEVTLTITSASQVDTDVLSVVIVPSLKLLATYNIRVDSPSGLSFGENQSTLWTVSDKPGGQIVEVDTLGNKVRTLNYSGMDLEGVSFDSRDSTLWVVEEDARQLIHLNSVGDVLSVQNISSVTGGGGLEGITLDTDRSLIYLLKEKDQGELITINELSQTQTQQRLSFAPDFSGLSYDATHDKLYVLSHEAASVFLINLDGSFTEMYAIDMVQPEGVVYDGLRQVFYIVDDTTEKLHKYGFWEQP